MHRLSSDAIPDAARLPACRDFFGSPMVGLEFAPLDPHRFAADVGFGILPAVNIGRGRFRDFRIDRTGPRIAADGKADFALIIAGAGEHRADQAGREALFGGGEAVLTTDAEPASVSYGGSADFLILQPSRQALSALVPGCDDAIARTIPADNEALRLVAGYAELLLESDALADPELRQLAATHLLDLIALAVGATRDAAALARGRGLRAARLASIKTDIAANLQRADLSIAAVAARQRVTPRYVARLFAEESTTFTDHVRHCRLERARRRLVDPRHSGTTIGAIAFESGFGDLSYFNRCFRARFGMTPSDVRHAANAAGED